MYLSAKKAALAVAVCSAFAGISSAMAVPVTINFSGSVTSATCDIQPYFNDALSNSIELGTTNVTGGLSESTPVSFVLKLKNGEECKGLGNNNAADISWSGDLDEHGLKNTGAPNKNIYVALSPVDGDGSTAAKIDDTGSVKGGGTIKSGANTVTYSVAAKPTSTSLPFNYKAKIVSNSGDLTPGAISTSISYTVAYK